MKRLPWHRKWTQITLIGVDFSITLIIIYMMTRLDNEHHSMRCVGDALLFETGNAETELLCGLWPYNRLILILGAHLFSFGSRGVKIGSIRFFADLRVTYLMDPPGSRNRVDQGQMKPGRVTKNSSMQTDCRIEGEPKTENSWSLRN